MNSSSSNPWGKPLKTTMPRHWRVGNKLLCADGPVIMGILNTTPDSFFDGGKYLNIDNALRRCEEMVKAGAAIIDVGGESTRPGSAGVSVDEELSRVIEVISQIKKRFKVPVSIDTTKAVVAKNAVEAGAEIINDVSGLDKDPDMINTVVKCGASVAIGHIKGTPSDMQENPEYEDVVYDVVSFLGNRVDKLVSMGVPKEKISVDPGIGFGKNLAHNYALISRMEELGILGCPIMMGISRKSFIAKTRGLETSDRLQPSIASAILSALKGASILRAHDVKETWEQLRLIEAVMSMET